MSNKFFENDYIINSLDASNDINIRLKSINLITNILLNKKCPQNLFAKVWPKILDLLDHIHSLDTREYVINLMYAFIIGQYDCLGIYRTKILEIINSHLFSKNEVYCKLQLFKLLTNNGHDLTFLENLFENVVKEIVNLLFDFPMSTNEIGAKQHNGIVSFLEIFTNLIKYNSNFMPDVLIGWILKKACIFANYHFTLSINFSQNFLKTTPINHDVRVSSSSPFYESLFQAIYRASSYGYLPQVALSQIVTFLCLLQSTCESDTNGQNKWKIMKQILSSSSGLNILEDLCGRLIYLKPLDIADDGLALHYKDTHFSKVCFESFDHRPFLRLEDDLAPVIVASAIELIGKFIWNDCSIEEIIYLPSHAILPLLYQALSWNSVVIDLKIVRALIRLINYSSAQITLPITAWEMLIQILRIVLKQMAEKYEAEPSLEFLVKMPTTCTNKHHILYHLQHDMCTLIHKLKSGVDDKDILENLYIALEPVWIYFVSPICEDYQLAYSIIRNKIESLLDMMLWQDYNKCFTVLQLFVDQFFYQSAIKEILNEKFGSISDAFLLSLNKVKLETIKGISEILNIVICPRQASELLSKIILPLMRHYFEDAELFRIHEYVDTTGETNIISALMKMMEMIFEKRISKHMGDFKTQEIWGQGLLECLRLIIMFQTTILQSLTNTNCEKAISNVETVSQKWQFLVMPIITMTFKRLFDITFFSYPDCLALKIASHFISCLRLQYPTSFKHASPDNYLFSQTFDQTALFYKSYLGCETRYIMLDCLTSIYVAHNSSGMNLLGLKQPLHLNILNFNVAPSLYLESILEQTLNSGTNIKCDSDIKIHVTYEEKYSYDYSLSPSLLQLPELYNQNCKNSFQMTLLEASQLYTMHGEDVQEPPCFPYSFILASIVDCIHLETNWKILCLILLKLPHILYCNKSLIIPYIFTPYFLISENCKNLKCKCKYSSDSSSNDEDCYYAPKIQNIMISLTRALCNITNEKERYFALESDYALECSRYSLDGNTVSEATRFPHRSEFLARFTYPSLIALVPYHSFLRDNGSETCLRLLHSLESGLRTSISVSHEPWSIYKQRGLTSALTLACIEMSETASVKFAPKLLLGLSKLSSTTVVALPVLEFLSVIANQPSMYSNFIEDEYMNVFAIALPFTNVFKFDHFIVSLAHIVIYKWYIKCRITFRKNFIKFILKGLNSSFVGSGRRMTQIKNQGGNKRPRSLSLNSKKTESDRLKNSQDIEKKILFKEDKEELDKRELKIRVATHTELVETCKEVLARYAFYNNQNQSFTHQYVTAGNKCVANQFSCLTSSFNLLEETTVEESWFLPDRLQIITITTYKSNLGGISLNFSDYSGIAKIHIRCVTGDFIWFMRLQQDILKTMSSEIFPDVWNNYTLFDQSFVSPNSYDFLKEKCPLRKTLSLSALNTTTYHLNNINFSVSPSIYNIINDINKVKGLTGKTKMSANSNYEMSPSYVFMSLFHNPFSHPKCKDLDSLPIILSRSSDTSRTISVLDCIPSYEAYKIGVIYIANNQPFDEALILSNESGSARYNDFLQGLGFLTKITDIASRNMYLGGLDIKGIDGDFTYTWKDGFTRVVYHIGTLMPNKKQDPYRHDKKMHIGNDFVTIVYNESGKEYPHGMITGQFCYVSIIIVPLDNSSNLVKLKCRKDMDIHLGGQMSRSLEISDRNLSHMVRQMALQSDLASKVFMSKMTTVPYPFASNWLERLRHLKRLRAKLPCKSEEFLNYRQKHYYAFTDHDSIELNMKQNLIAENDFYTDYPI